MTLSLTQFAANCDVNHNYENSVLNSDWPEEQEVVVGLVVGDESSSWKNYRWWGNRCNKLF